jgi:hypothetical protein
MNQKQYYYLLSQIKASARRSPVYLIAADDYIESFLKNLKQGPNGLDYH